MKKSLIFFILYLFFSVNGFGSAGKNSDTEITKKIRAIANSSNSVIGVTAIHIETHDKVSYNGSTPFFMASTAKVPIAITFLNRVDENQEYLNHVVRLNHNNSIPGSGGLSYALDKRALDISLSRLLNLMLVHSDNSASDAILQEVNGPTAVREWMQMLGFRHIRINRTFLELFIDVQGADRALIKQFRTSQKLNKTFSRIPLSERMRARKRLENDIRDTTTPDEMALLLSALYKGQLLSPYSTSLLIHTMEQCKTGRNRIRGLLPANTKVAHKTGTWSISSSSFLRNPKSKQFYRYASDVGIITLPQNKGHLAIAVYVKSKTTSDHTRSRVIALVSRALYDYFSFHKV